MFIMLKIIFIKLDFFDKHCFVAAIEVGPQPSGVLRADIFNVVKEALDLTLQWLQKFSSGRKQCRLLSFSFFAEQISA